VLGINAHQALDLIRLASQDSQSLINGADQFSELCEIAVMGSFGLDFFPEVFDRIVIGRVGR